LGKKKIDKSGAEEGTACPSREPPAGPLELQSALTNRVLGGGVCEALPGTPSALLCFDFSLRLEAIGCSRAHFPNLAVGSPPRVVSQFPVKNPKAVFRNITRSCETTRERGPRAETLVPRGDERASSRWLQMAQKNRSAGTP